MPLDDRLVISTPENIELEVTIAGLGSRFTAQLADLLIKILCMIPVSMILGTISALAGINAEIVMYAGMIIAGFLLMFAYDPLFEILRSGRTPGKKIVGIRVVPIEGGPLGVGQSISRNLLRLVDMMPIGYLTGSLAILASKRRQRLGDLAAGTIVIRDAPDRSTERSRLAVVMPFSVPPYAVQTWNVDGVSAREMEVAHRFLGRRTEIDPFPRYFLASSLAERLFPKVGGAPANWHPEHFLEGVVTAKSIAR